MIKKIVALFASFFFVVTPAMAATTINVPFLTWESGKQQSIVLGGPGSNGNWKMQLSGGASAPLIFTKSATDSQGTYRYTLDIPKDLTPGGYVIETVEENGTKTVVAGVQIKARETYRITEIPTDLKLLAIIFAGITALFTAMRARKYANLSFAHRNEEAGNVLYRFRRERLASQGDSLAKYVALHSGETLHRISPIAWALLPWLAIPLGVFTAIQIQFDSAIPNGPIYLFFACALLGALDATTGVSLALGLGFMHVALGNVTSLRSLVVAVAFTLSWYFPAMISSLVSLASEKDFVRLTERTRTIVVAGVAAAIGGISVVMSTILTDSLVIDRQSSDFLRWPLAAAVFVVLFVKLAFGTEINQDKTVNESLYVARVVSPGLATTLFFATMLLIYVWTNEFLSALVGGVIISAPYFLLFLVFPQLGRLARGGGKRSLAIEALTVACITFAIYFAIQALPMAVISKSRAFILLGLVPSLIHALYSVALASGEYEARQKEMEEVR